MINLGLGLLTASQVSQVNKLAEDCDNAYISSNETSSFYSNCQAIPFYIEAVSGGISTYDVRTIDNPNFSFISSYLNNRSSNISQVLHVEDSPKRPKFSSIRGSPIGDFSMGSSSISNFSNNFTNMIAQENVTVSLNYLNKLLPNLKCLFYNGNFDLRVGPNSVLDILSLLNSPYDDISLVINLG